MARPASRCSRFGAERDESMIENIKPESPNQPDAVNPAIGPRFQVGRQWRGVTDPHRYAAA